MIRPSPGRRRPGFLAVKCGFRAFRMLGVDQLEHAVHGPAGALGAGRHEMRVRLQREGNSVMQEVCSGMLISLNLIRALPRMAKVTGYLRRLSLN